MGLFAGAALVCLAFGQTAQSQTAPTLGAAKPPTPDTIRKACLPEHVKYCPNGKGGTRSDIACMQQHHTSLSLSCRNILRQSVVGPGGRATNIEAH